jgi:hypothetical protein
VPADPVNDGRPAYPDQGSGLRRAGCVVRRLFRPFRLKVTESSRELSPTPLRNLSVNFPFVTGACLVKRWTGYNLAGASEEQLTGNLRKCPFVDEFLRFGVLTLDRLDVFYAETNVYPCAKNFCTLFPWSLLESRSRTTSVPLGNSPKLHPLLRSSSKSLRPTPYCCSLGYLSSLEPPISGVKVHPSSSI